MELKPISGGQIRTESVSSSKSSGKSKSSSSDKIEISAEAKKMSVGSVEGKDMNAINQRISSGFYNSEEVITKLATAILKLLSK
jgi:negative regulator of flagellin synthesis FlgM